MSVGTNPLFHTHAPSLTFNWLITILRHSISPLSIYNLSLLRDQDQTVRHVRCIHRLPPKHTPQRDHSPPFSSFSSSYRLFIRNVYNLFHRNSLHATSALPNTELYDRTQLCHEAQRSSPASSVKSQLFLSFVNWRTTHEWSRSHSAFSYISCRIFLLRIIHPFWAFVTSLCHIGLLRKYVV